MTSLSDQVHAGDARADAAADPRRRAWRRAGTLAFIAALVAAYLSSGIYAVGPDERAVIRRFGAVYATVGPGMHYRIPWPVDRLDVVKTTSVMKVGVGFAIADGETPK